MNKKRIIAFGVREDEIEYFEKYKENYSSFEISTIREGLSIKNVEKCKGYDGVIFIGGCHITKDVLVKLKEFGIKYISSRSIGYDNVDLEAAKELGIKVSNARYSPFSVAEFALMSGMLLLRNIPQSIRNTSEYNFSLKGLIGREMRSLTIGIIGTGKIGRIVADYYSYLGAKVICYDLYPSSEKLNYVSLDEVFEKSDLLSLHIPLTKETRHMINDESIKKLKDGVLLVNTARGDLIENKALVENLLSGKIGGAAIDTLENESGIFFKDCREKGFDNPYLKELLKMNNVFITSHHAFYTTQAVSDMVESALECQKEFFETGESKNQL